MSELPRPQIRCIQAEDIGNNRELLALNNEFHMQTSLLDSNQWDKLIAACDYAHQVVPAAALLIAFNSGASYDNPNYRWFSERFDSFVYVDRIVVSSQHQGQGLAKILYEGLFQQARDAGYKTVGCEVNQDPPNPGSDAFHARMGFVEAGSAKLSHSDKVVRYLTKSLS